MSKKKQRKTKKQSSNQTTSKSNLLIAIALGIFAFLLYANTIGHSYVLDDYSAIKDNYVTQQGLEGLPTIWQEHYRYGFWNSKATLYRPVPLSIFAILWEISPDNTQLYHFFNVLFFAFTASLLFFLLRRLLPKVNLLIPLAITALFVAHPIHVEVVANIKSLDEILALFFSLKAIYLLFNYLDTKKIFWFIASVIVYGIALFSKESSVAFIFIFPLVLYFFTKEKWLNIIQLSVSYLIPAAIFLYTRHQIVGGLGIGDGISFLDNAILGAKDWVGQLAMTLFFLGKYLVNLVAPYSLSSDYGYNQIPLMSMMDWRPILSFLLYAGMGIFALWKFKDRNLAAFGILFFLITFAPLSNFLIKIGTSYGDRMVYIPSLGFIIALVYFIFKYGKGELAFTHEKLSSLISKNSIPVGLIGLLVILYSFKTIDRNQDWDTSYTLYQQDIKVSPNSAKLRYHYSLELSQKGLDLPKDDPQKRVWFDKAKEQLEKAVEIYPDYHDAYAQLGLYYFRINNRPKALEMYQKAIDHKPNSPKAYSNMGILYFEAGDVENAQRVYEKAVQLDPRFVDARRNLGSVYARKGQFDKAIEQFAEALKYAPDDATINFYLGSAYRDAGKTGQGQPYLEKACRLDSALCKK